MDSLKHQNHSIESESKVKVKLHSITIPRQDKTRFFIIVQGAVHTTVTLKQLVSGLCLLNNIFQQFLVVTTTGPIK